MDDPDRPHDRNPDEPRPWEQPGLVRRDCEPHRAGLLGTLGQVSMLCGLLSCCLLITAPVGFVLGTAVWALAAHDLGRMRAGRMGPAGERDTRSARNYAKAGLVTSCLTLGTIALLCLRAIIP